MALLRANQSLTQPTFANIQAATSALLKNVSEQRAAFASMLGDGPGLQHAQRSAGVRAEGASAA
eukprot:653507-Rhodomonas_salina.1